MRGLSLVFPELTASLQRATAQTKRNVALAACEFAVRNARLNDPLAERALSELRAGRPLTRAIRSELDALAERLDGEYFDLRDAAEEGRATSADWLPLFEKARALSALSFAGASDPLEAASEAVYEAAATIDEGDRGELAGAIRLVLEQESP